MMKLEQAEDDKRGEIENSIAYELRFIEINQ